jgi:PilZ domain
VKAAGPRRADRRRAERKEPSSPLWAQLLLEVDSAVRALSTRGMMVRVAFPPPVGTAHTFVLTFESMTLRVRGVVRNVGPAAQPGPPRYDVGVEFEELDPSARQFLERFVDSRL